MKLLSVDLGVRNLAWCVLEREPTKDPKWTCAPFAGVQVKIHSWKLVDVTDGVEEDLNLNKVDIAECVPLFIAALKKHKEELTDGVEMALLEQQPVGRIVGPGKAPINNIRTKVLSHILQAFLLEHGVKDIRFVSPRLKTASEETETYRERKAAAKLLARQSLDVIGDGWATWWDEKKGKKDDLADCLLQGIVAARKKVPQKRKREKEKVEKKQEEVDAFVPDL